jgi:glycopeptide antibiotics resistance protein
LNPQGDLRLAAGSVHAQWPSRRRLFVFACACSLVAVYLSLIPFDFTYVPFREALSLLLGSTSRHVSRTDFVVNVLLLLPIGFFAAGALEPDRGRPRGWVLLPVAAGCVSFSVLLEFTQAFLPGRTPSLFDVLAESVGGIVGGLAWTLVGPTAMRRVHTALAPAERPGLAARVLLGYAILFALGHLLPFDVTVDRSELAWKLRTGRISLVPFSSLPADPLAALVGAAGGILAAIPIGLFTAIGLTPRGTRHNIARAFLLGALLVAGLEAAQMFILSRYADVTDVILGCAGVYLGAVLSSRSSVRLLHALSAASSRSLVNAAVVGWLLVLVAYHWYPFRFSTELPSILSRLRSVHMIPFEGYYDSPPIQAATQIVDKVLIAAPLGWLLASRASRRLASHQSSLRLAGPWLFASGALLVIEAGQLLLPGRVADPGDVVIGSAGVMAGLWFGRRIGRLHER